MLGEGGEACFFMWEEGMVEGFPLGGLVYLGGRPQVVPTGCVRDFHSLEGGFI